MMTGFLSNWSWSGRLHLRSFLEHLSECAVVGGSARKLQVWITWMYPGGNRVALALGAQQGLREPYCIDLDNWPKKEKGGHHGGTVEAEQQKYNNNSRPREAGVG